MQNPHISINFLCVLHKKNGIVHDTVFFAYITLQLCIRFDPFLSASSLLLQIYDYHPIVIL